MNQCAIQRGFFTLRTCDRPVIGYCSSCGRAVCFEHAAQATPLLCVECGAQGQSSSWDSTSWDDPYSPGLYRSSYYHETGHQPTVGGGKLEPFDDDDIRAFDGEPKHEKDLDDEDRRAGLYDS